MKCRLSITGCILANRLELVFPIVEEKAAGLVATPYFEDYLFELIQSIGGEGSSLDDVSISDALKSQIGLILQRLEETDVGVLLAHITALEQRINDLELQQ